MEQKDYGKERCCLVELWEQTEPKPLEGEGRGDEGGSLLYAFINWMKSVP